MKNLYLRSKTSKPDEVGYCLPVEHIAEVDGKPTMVRIVIQATSTVHKMGEVVRFLLAGKVLCEGTVSKVEKNFRLKPTDKPLFVQLTCIKVKEGLVKYLEEVISQ